MFGSMTAWFSASVEDVMHTRWRDNGGTEAGFDEAQFIFSADASSEDTERIFSSPAYLQEHLTVFHPDYISECVKEGDVEEVVLGDYFLPSKEFQHFWDGWKKKKVRSRLSEEDRMFEEMVHLEAEIENHEREMRAGPSRLRPHTNTNNARNRTPPRHISERDARPNTVAGRSTSKTATENVAASDVEHRIGRLHLRSGDKNQTADDQRACVSESNNRGVRQKSHNDVVHAESSKQPCEKQSKSQSSRNELEQNMTSGRVYLHDSTVRNRNVSSELQLNDWHNTRSDRHREANVNVSKTRGNENNQVVTNESRRRKQNEPISERNKSISPAKRPNQGATESHQQNRSRSHDPRHATDQGKGDHSSRMRLDEEFLRLEDLAKVSGSVFGFKVGRDGCRLKLRTKNNEQ